MKILILTNHSYMFWRFRRELTEALLVEHEVVIGTPFVGHEEDLAGLGARMVEIPIDRRSINPFTDFSLFLRYRKLLKTERPDLVITYSIKPNIYAGLAARMLGIPYCANVQGLGTAFQRKGLAWVVTRLYKSALKRAETTFFENEANAEVFRTRGIQGTEAQTVLCGAGVNLDTYALATYPANDVPHFLYLGRIMREKGMGELFAAARRLYAEGVPFLLDLVGFYEDEYKDDVEELVDMGVAVFHGFQSDPRPFYHTTDCVVLPSYHEGMSNVLLEAAAVGRPVITSDIPGCRETVVAGESGLLIPPQDDEALFLAMKQMAELSADRRARMGEVGRAHIAAHFDKADVVAATLSALLPQGLPAKTEELYV